MPTLDDLERMREREIAALERIADALEKLTERRHSPDLSQRVEHVAGNLRPDVVRIRYSFEDDWSGQSAVHFRIVLSDEVLHSHRLYDVTSRVQNRILEGVKPESLDGWPTSTSGASPSRKQ